VTAAIPAARPAVLADLIPGALVRDVALVIGGAAFVGLLAQVSFHVPGTPVPITGQTFAVLLGGAALGWRRALPAMALYLAAGLIGVPWYAGHATGTIHLPSLGYIVGYVAVGPLMGWAAAHGTDRTPLRTALTMLAGTAIIYLFGAPWLAASLHLSAAAAWREGVRPFLVGDTLKVLAAAGLLPGTWKLLGLRGARRQG
jgi:biotin transport system substrate-specific component